MNEHKTIATETDNPFHFTVYASSREAEVASWGWSPEEQRAFLQMQYHCQQRSYQIQYPHLESSIIMFGNTSAGHLLLAKNGLQTVVVDITLLAEFQSYRE
ncbi:MAG: hypothetical protein ACOX6L_06800 [Syntrophomonadaceae bacterium]|jgi:hypothetical protein